MHTISMDGKDEGLGFTITPEKSSIHPKEVLPDLDFADDVALLSDQLKQAQELLTNRVQGSGPRSERSQEKVLGL